MSDTPFKHSHAPNCHPAGLSIDRLLQDCDVSRTRASGPGGQHRNKVETAIRILHRPSGVSTIANERRSQEENLRVAIGRLRLLLAVNVRSVTSEHVEPSALWSSRLRDGKIQCNDRHADFPVMLAEAMDAVDAKSYDVRKAAAALGCSTSQLIRFIARVPEALQNVNNARAAAGMHRLQK